MAERLPRLKDVRGLGRASERLRRKLGVRVRGAGAEARVGGAEQVGRTQHHGDVREEEGLLKVQLVKERLDGNARADIEHRDQHDKQRTHPLPPRVVVFHGPARRVCVTVASSPRDTCHRTQEGRPAKLASPVVFAGQVRETSLPDLKPQSSL